MNYSCANIRVTQNSVTATYKLHMAVSQYFAILEISAREYELCTWLSVGDNEVQSEHAGECKESSPPAHEEHNKHAQ